jgi:hypothetical protein
VRSATGAHNQELVGAPDQGAGSGGPPETKSLAVGRPLGSIQQPIPVKILHHPHHSILYSPPEFLEKNSCESIGARG